MLLYAIAIVNFNNNNYAASLIKCYIQYIYIHYLFCFCHVWFDFLYIKPCGQQILTNQLDQR